MLVQSVQPQQHPVCRLFLYFRGTGVLHDGHIRCDYRACFPLQMLMFYMYLDEVRSVQDVG